MSKISRFTTKVVTLAKNVVTDYVLVSLHCLRVYLDESYRKALDLLSEMPHILGRSASKRAISLTTRRWLKCLIGSK